VNVYFCVLISNVCLSQFKKRGKDAQHQSLWVDNLMFHLSTNH